MKTISIASMVVALTASALAYAGGPSEWRQYRMHPSHNAVFDDGGPALPTAFYRTGDQVRANPVVIGDRLFIGNHLTGGMFSFDAKTTKALWHDDNPWFRHAPNWIHSDMVYVKDRIYVGYGNRVFESATVRGTGESGVMAVDPKTGKTIWDHRTVGEVMPTPAYWHGTLYIATGGAELIALDPSDGSVRWRLKLPGWVSMSSPSVQNGMLYVGAMNSVVGVDLRERKIRWVYRADLTFTDVPPAVAPDGTVVITGMQSRSAAKPEDRKRYPHARGYLQFIYAFDGETGKLRWKHLLGAGAVQDNNTSGNPTIADGRVYVGSPYTHSLFAYEVDNGKRVWEYPTGAKIKGAPAVKNGVVYFGDTNGFLHAVNADSGETLRRADGRELGKLKLGGSKNAAKNVALAPGGPVIINQDIYVGSQDGFIYRVSIPAWRGIKRRAETATSD